MGGALHPIMLNVWFHGSVGFHNGVRASAGLNGILLIISVILMKPRLPPSSKKVGSILNSFSMFLRDLPYVITILGYVIGLSLSYFASDRIYRTVLVLSGLYYPIFFLQLNAIKNGINPTLAFYTVSFLLFNFFTSLTREQIAILNAASAFGRVVPNLFVYRFGVYNMIIPCIFTAAILVFCTFAVKDVVGTMIFAIFYGFFSGACQYKPTEAVHH